MPKKILLADDSITIQKVVELTFSDGDYEVVAVNNGARAIQKLSEMRPDIILSDIIMPEKNGYEVCEYVKSHPDLRTIPVVLLTGTFEPFDPDRADKAGCDAVVTKPFESQSLIQRVDELIEQSRAAAAGVPAGTPWIDASTGAAPESQQAGAVDHEPDIFAAAAPPAASMDMPFDTPPSPFGAADAFEPASEPPPPAEATPWDDQPAFGGETRALPTVSYEELERQAAPAEPQSPASDAAPWDEQPAFGGESKFPPMGYDDLQQATTAAAGATAPEASPWDEQPASSDESGQSPPLADAPSTEDAPWDSAAPAEPAAAASPWDEPVSGGETRAFPTMSFDDLQQAAAAAPEAAGEQPSSADALWDEPAAPSEEAAAPPAAETSPWDEQPAAYGGETRAFPKMSFDQLQQMASAPAEEPQPQAAPAENAWDDPAAPAQAPASIWDEPAAAQPAAESMWSEPAAEPTAGSSTWDEPAADTAPPTESSTWEEAAAEAAPPAAAAWDDQPSAGEPQAAPAWDEQPSQPASADTSWEEPAAAAETSSEPSWSLTSEAPESAAAESDGRFSTAGSAPFGAEVGDEAPAESRDEQPAWSPTPATAERSGEDEPAYTASAPAATTDAFVPIAAASQTQGSGFTGELSDEQLDRIARRVIELLSDKVIRDIAWEVIPDTAQMVVKERIRQLESEA